MTERCAALGSLLGKCPGIHGRHVELAIFLHRSKVQIISFKSSSFAGCSYVPSVSIHDRTVCGLRLAAREVPWHSRTARGTRDFFSSIESTNHKLQIELICRVIVRAVREQSCPNGVRPYARC